MNVIRRTNAMDVTASITRTPRRQDTKEFDTFVLWRPGLEKSCLSDKRPVYRSDSEVTARPSYRSPWPFQQLAASHWPASSRC